MTMRKVTVVYTGPGAEGDPREMKVSKEESERLVEGGLWSLKSKMKKEKEVTSNA